MFTPEEILANEPPPAELPPEPSPKAKDEEQVAEALQGQSAGPVHETTHIPPPRADVMLPPPPSPAPGAGVWPEASNTGRSLAEWFWVLGLGLVLFVVSLASGAGLPLSLLVFLVAAALTSHGLKRNKRLVRPATVPTPPVRTRSIPQWVKIYVATRDGGRCRQCGSDYDLQYDHIVPYSRGGSSTDVSNIQLLCGPCNRRKSNRYVG